MNKYHKRYKSLAKWALVFSIALAIIYTCICTMNTKTANQLIAKTTETLIKLFDAKVAPTSIVFDWGKSGRATFYSDENYRFYIKTYPTYADNTVTYTTDNENVTIAPDGTVTCHSTTPIKVTVTATSVHNEKVFVKYRLWCRGLSPTDPRIDHLEMRFSKSNYGTAVPMDQLEVGYPYHVNVWGIVADQYLDELNLTPENNEVHLDPEINFWADDQQDETLFHRNRFTVTFLKPFNGTVETRLYDTTMQYFDVPELKEFVKVETNPTKNYIPQDYLVPYVIHDKGNEYSTKVSDGVYICDVPADYTGLAISALAKSGINNACTVSIKEEDYGKVTPNGKYAVYRHINRGQATVYVKSILNPHLVTTFILNFVPNVPQKLTVVCPNTDKYATKLTFTSKFDNNPLDENKVAVKVLEGADVLTILSDDGKNIEIHKTGTVVLRFYSVSFPEIYDDVTVEIKNFAGTNIVGKIFGHIAIFCLLGFGLAGAFYLTGKSKLKAFLLMFVILFVFAGFSETVQSPLFNNNRGASFSDVILNTNAGLLGVAIFVGLHTLRLYLMKKFKPVKYAKIKEALDSYTWRDLLPQKRQKKNQPNQE